MRITVRPLLLTFLMMMVFVSCSKDVVFNSESGNDGKQTSSTLIVRTRAGDATTDGVVSYPVNIYVFDRSGTCVSVTAIETEETPLSMALKEGIYTIYAVAGASADDYDLPAQENATTESAVSLKAGKQHGDLMTAHNTVYLEDGETNTLTLTMSRKVMLLEEVTVNNVPSSVTSVSVTVAPLYETLRLNGTLDGSNGAQTVALTKQDGTKVWKNTDGVYMLGASGGATVSVKMKTSDNEIKSYSYTCTEELEANYKLTIEGTYTESMEIELTGTIEGTEWAGVRNISFNFDESGSVNTPGGDDTPDDNTGNQTVPGETVPALHSVYNGAVVVSVEPRSDNTTAVTLMSPLQTKTNLTFDAGDQSSVQSAVNAAIKDLAIDGITGWRLPTKDEIVYITTNYESINKVLNTLGGVSTITPGLSYFYQDSDGTISSYCHIGTVEFPNSRLRVFATVIFK